MNNKLFSGLAVFCVTASGFAQSNIEKQVDDNFKLNLSEDVSIFNLENGTILAVNSTLGFAVTDDIAVNFSLPFYSETNDAGSPEELAWQLSNGTYGQDGIGLSDAVVEANYAIFKNFEFFGAKNTQLNVLGGVQLPLNSQYSSGNFVYFIGGEFEFTLDKISVEQDFHYFFVNDFTYNPYLGGFVSNNIVQSETDVFYAYNNDLKLGVNVTQIHSDGQKLILVGPLASYNVNSALSIDAGVGFAVVDDLDYDNLDTVVSFGLNFKF
jgi:hypothetical protein